MTPRLQSWFLHTPLFVMFVIAPFFVPRPEVLFDLSTVTGVISLLFTILIGFFIATATTNYLRLQTLLAQENSSLISLCEIGSLIQPSAKRRLVDAVDLYAITALNFELVDYVEKTIPAFAKLNKVLNQIRPSSGFGESLVQNFYDVKMQLACTRQEIPLTARRIVTWVHWIVLILLATLLIGLMYLLRDGSFLSSLVVGCLTVACYLTLRLLYQIDGNLFSEEKMTFLNSQIIFVSIGKLNYFPAYTIKQRRVSRLVPPYRTGVFKNPAEPLPAEIKIVRK